ncbi:N-acetylmuramoyl-L-alanine amidase [Wolbachia endosymbiont of Folsomia candida]|uniref:N-acetylmuramoyl-L-alanine amidase n=1 Tax=Wolbachia endosymbiont of Folsomia candida TaxID=169402 RepID=UPI000A6EC74A|nr:N-acetylmuramoyl-L-alanine amidase [Wolbachia endosymbiont of Folsomia candida]APR98368.1 hypothetical protein ASM33_03700 [Wolbachia endosymbiont of Folsomia candida]
MFKKFFIAGVIIACFVVGIFHKVRIRSVEGNDRDVIKTDIDDIKKSTSISKITGDLSPNYASRITNAKPEMIILHHTICNTASSAVDWFKEQNSKISAHFVIGKDGAITYMVPIEKSAWHAGLSYIRVPYSEAKLQSSKNLINYFKESSDQDIQLNVAKLLGECGNQHFTDQQKEMMREVLLSDEAYIINLKREDTIELAFLNDYSIGIELVNTGNEPYPNEQMLSAAHLISYLMNRFQIKKNMIFSHFEIGTIEYDDGLENYILRKPDPSKYLDWEYLEKNGIGIHQGNHISASSLGRLLYKYGDNTGEIINLKRRLNNIGYKIEPFIGQKAEINFPEDDIEYTSAFDDKLALVILQFSSRYLPKNFRKDLPYTRLEIYDVLPQSAVDALKNAILSLVDTFIDQIPLQKREKYQSVINSNMSNFFENAMETINSYYQGNLRYKLGYHSTWNHNLKNPILSNLKNLIQELDDKELSDLYSRFGFDDKFSEKFSVFYTLIGKEFQNQFHKEFMPKIRSIGWSELQEESLKYVEDELLKYKNS